LHMSPLFQAAVVETYGTRVAGYWLPGQEAAGRAALDYTVAALRIYSDYFGHYPYRDLRVAPAPINFRGMEYPQVTLLGVELYTRFQNNLEVLAVHEAAHQWWYQIVHNDPVNAPWLDEALAEYSVGIYFAQLRGQRAAAQLRRLRWQTPLDLLRNRDLDTTLNRPVGEFENSSQYETVVYGKGALFYTRLHDILGERRFRRLLQDYLATYRYGIVSTAQWRADLKRLQLPQVDALLDEWVGPAATPLPLPVATPTPPPTDGTVEPIGAR
jgi:aminopeptidase N